MDNYNLFEVFSQTAEQLFRDVDLSPAMVYLVDTVNANALPFLAAQFDVEGFKGWNLATTDTQKRDLIKSAIELKRKRGTPFAIKRALASIGFTNVEIQEGIQIGDGPFNYDGEYNYDGTIMHGGFSWASFRVIISVQDVTVITDDMKELIRQLIIYYKNARSFLTEIIYQDDNQNYYDGESLYDGTINH